VPRGTEILAATNKVRCVPAEVYSGISGNRWCQVIGVVLIFPVWGVIASFMSVCWLCSVRVRIIVGLLYFFFYRRPSYPQWVQLESLFTWSSTRLLAKGSLNRVASWFLTRLTQPYSKVFPAPHPDPSDSNMAIYRTESKTHSSSSSSERWPKKIVYSSLWQKVCL
jgi:hypothetical protein